MVSVMEKPFEYQSVGAEWLKLRSHALLADEMGLGKTRQAVMASDSIGAKSILIICPSVARINWKREFDLWSILSPQFKVCESQTDFPTKYTIVSFDYATNHKDRLMNQLWDLLIIDESHMVKAVDAKRTSAILGSSGIIRKVKRCWALTGTPAPNHAGELWPLLYTFGVTTLSYTAFIHKYCNTYRFHDRLNVTGTKVSMIPEVKKLLSKIMLRRLKEEVMKDLPPIHFTHFEVEPGVADILMQPGIDKYFNGSGVNEKELHEELDKQRKFIDHALENIGLGANGMKALDGIANSISTLRQYTGLQKVEPIAKLIDEELKANAYDKIVIFAVHRGVIEGLRAKLFKHKPVTLYGGTPPKDRQKAVDKFQNNKRCRIFIGNILAAGTAITLTAAHNVLFVEQSWVPGDNAQAAMRCHRIGQDKPVYVRFAGLADSFDNKISMTLKRKSKELTEIFDV